MVALAINGITASCRADSFTSGLIPIGESGRAFSGRGWSNTRALKRALSWKSGPLPIDEARAWEKLLGLGGHTCGFEADAWTDQGVEGVITSGARAIDRAKYGATSFKAPGTISWALGARFASEWSVFFWEYYTAWRHYGLTSASQAAGKYWYEGALNTGTPGAFSVAGGLVKISTVSAAWYDDLIVLPFVVPATWVPMMQAHTRALPAVPRVDVSGDLLGTEILTCRGSAQIVEELQAQIGGSWVKRAIVQFDLEEV